ncbi:MAG: NAD(P)/FAD-dependent oxidoreductase [Pseudomonadota bacterium]
MTQSKEFDAVIVGAGISGMYQLHMLRQQGLSVRVYEAGTNVGGTWYWNRYPGARFDSESYSYAYSFSEEILDEWRWKEHFSAQPDTLEYLNFVADKLDLRRDIQFETRVKSARYDKRAKRWTIETESGETASSRYLVTAIGVLSEPYLPNFKGIDSFKGRSWHTWDWPREDIDLSDKRVGVIGTGATAVQMITEIAKNIGHLTVFQRTANYILPLGNREITDDEHGEIQAKQQQIFDRCEETFGGFIHGFKDGSTFDLSKEEREALYEELYQQPGFALWLGNYADILTDDAANAELSEFVQKKIRARIDDAEKARILVPNDHPFGTKRVPLDSGYYEAYNRDNVDIVSIKETPIEAITEHGIKTSAKEYEFDIIIYATGFDAVTGAFTKMDIYGEDGTTLNEKWADGPRTYLGIQSQGFPNLFTVVGPHNGATFCNIPRCIEQNVEWVSECIKHLEDNAIVSMQPKAQAEEEWTKHVHEVIEGTLIPKTDSWFLGANVEGKKRVFLLYAGGSPLFRERCDNEAASGYESFNLQ